MPARRVELGAGEGDGHAGAGQTMRRGRDRVAQHGEARPRTVQARQGRDTDGPAGTALASSNPARMKRGEGELREFGREGQGLAGPIYREIGGRGEGSDGGEGAPVAP
jgi:hypothetical protein